MGIHQSHTENTVIIQTLEKNVLKFGFNKQYNVFYSKFNCVYRHILRSRKVHYIMIELMK